MDFATLHLDTYKVVKLLQSKGYTKKEAEGFIEAIQEITLSGVATKQDMQDVKGEIQDIRPEINTLKIDIQNGKNETLRFLIIQTITLIGVMIALIQFL